MGATLVDLGVTGLDYAVVTAFFVSVLISLFRSRRIGVLELSLAGVYLIIWLMSVLWGPLLLKVLTTAYALIIGVCMLIIRKHQTQELAYDKDRKLRPTNYGTKLRQKSR